MTHARALVAALMAALLAACGGSGADPDGGRPPDAHADAGVGRGALCLELEGDTVHCFTTDVTVSVDLEEGQRAIYLQHGGALVGSSCDALDDVFRVVVTGIAADATPPIPITMAAARLAYPAAAERCDGLIGPEGAPAAATGTIEELDDTVVRGALDIAAGAGAGTSCEGPAPCSGATPALHVDFFLDL